VTGRRDVLKALVAGAAAFMPSASLFAQSRARRGRIDVHHHMLPPFQENMAARKYTLQTSLSAMDAFGCGRVAANTTLAACAGGLASHALRRGVERTA
jgi:hypothetical protein